MKGKVVRGSGFRGVLNYVLNADKKAYIVGGNLVSRDAKGLAREFGYVRRLRDDCQKPVLHISLRLPGGEDVSDEQWLKITLTLFKLLRLSQARPWVLFKHLGEHVHLVTSRVDYNGKIWTGEWEALRLIEATQQIEKLFNLTVTPGLRGQNRKQVRLTSGQLQKINREVNRGEEPAIPAKVAMAERIEKAINEGNGTFDSFKDRLEKLGVITRLNVAKTTDYISGVSFEFEGVTMKGSKIARAYSWRGLNQLLAERKTAYENPGTPQPAIRLGPREDDRRTAPPKLARTGDGIGPIGNRLAKGGNPTASPVPAAMLGIGGGIAGDVPDLLLSLLAGASVTAGVGTGTGSIFTTARAVGTARKRIVKNAEDDEGPGADGPTMSL